MALSTYDDLVVELLDFADRQDLEAKAPVLIALAESQLDRALRVREMHVVLDDVLSGATYALPSDFEDIASLTLTTSLSDGIKYLPPPEFFALEANNQSAVPMYCTFIGTNLYVTPIAPADTPFRLIYFAKLPGLSLANETNWLLSKAPDLYLAAAIAELETYVNNDERIPMWKERRDEAIDEMNGRERLLRSRFAGQRSRRSPW